jgi:hypothetical protein
MPAGNYYIGDLCYVLESRWDQVVDLMYPDRDGAGVEGNHTLSDDTTLCIYSTAYGDGQYSDGRDGTYLVDSGTIGCVSTTCIDSDNSIDGGSTHFFETAFQCYSDGRVLHFGSITIDTAGESDYDEDDEPDYDEHYGSEDD